MDIGNQAVPVRSRTKAKFVLPLDHEYECIPAGEQGEAALRIRSIVPLVVQKCNLFCRSLRKRESGQFDVVDVLQEIWVALLEKDRYFNPNLGIKYSTWALLVVKQQLGILRNRSHMVNSPRDTAAKLKNREHENPALIAKISHAIAETYSLEPATFDIAHGEHANDDPIAEDRKFCVNAVMDGLGELPRLQAQVLAWKWGLLGSAPKSMTEIAQLLGPPMTSSACGRMAADAENELADILQTRGLAYTSCEASTISEY